MPHDKRGEELRVGDTVLVPCVVKAIHLTADYCNVDLETKEPMHPFAQKTALVLNSKQTVKPRATFEYVMAGTTEEDQRRASQREGDTPAEVPR
jgi:hypothetical protein